MILTTKTALTFNNHFLHSCLGENCTIWYTNVTDGENRHYREERADENYPNHGEKLFFHNKLEKKTNEVLSILQLDLI